jgi:hypothetical protein
MCGLLMMVVGALGLIGVLLALVIGGTTQAEGGKMLVGAVVLLALGFLFFKMERES